MDAAGCKVTQHSHRVSDRVIKGLWSVWVGNSVNRPCISGLSVGEYPTGEPYG